MCDIYGDGDRRSGVYTLCVCVYDQVFTLYVCMMMITGDQVARYTELNYLKPVTDVAYHPRDHILAICSLGENQPVLIYKYDPFSEWNIFFNGERIKIVLVGLSSMRLTGIQMSHCLRLSGMFMNKCPETVWDVAESVT